jgi:hypothetical protein
MPAPTSREVAFELAELVKDIVNAAGNQQPYSAAELDRIATPVLEKFYERYGPLPGEDGCKGRQS